MSLLKHLRSQQLGIKRCISFTSRLRDEKDNNVPHDDMDPLYEGHIPTTILQKLILAGGSSIVALTAPWRGDMVALNGEVMPGTVPALESVMSRMLESEEGSLILNHRPLITPSTVTPLESLPANTLGRTYADWMGHYGYSPEDRLPVQFVDDADLSYVLTRYRQTHDVTHAVLGMPTDMVGEVVVKVVEGLQTHLPMCLFGGLLGPLRFKQKQRDKYKKLLPWAMRTGAEAGLLMNVYYEQRWEQDIDDFRKELNITNAPIKLL